MIVQLFFQLYTHARPACLAPHVAPACQTVWSDTRRARAIVTHTRPAAARDVLRYWVPAASLSQSVALHSPTAHSANACVTPQTVRCESVSLCESVAPCESVTPCFPAAARGARDVVRRAPAVADDQVHHLSLMNQRTMMIMTCSTLIVSVSGAFLRAIMWFHTGGVHTVCRSSGTARRDHTIIAGGFDECYTRASTAQPAIVRWTSLCDGLYRMSHQRLAAMRQREP